MDTVRFIGKVVPVSVGLDLAQARLGFKLLNGKAVKMACKINQSNVQVVCEMESFADEDIHELLVRCTDFVRLATNLGCFAEGIGMMLVFETVIYPNKRRAQIAQGDPTKKALVTSYTFPVVGAKSHEEFNAIIRIVNSDIHLMGAMNDLVTALFWNHQTPIVCGRVLDSLLRSVAPTMERRKGWPILHQAVNADRRYMVFISDISTNPRHGDWSTMSAALLKEISDRTWIIINRFIEYRKNGSVPLSAPQYPLLISSNEPS